MRLGIWEPHAIAGFYLGFDGLGGWGFVALHELHSTGHSIVLPGSVGKSGSTISFSGPVYTHHVLRAPRTLVTAWDHRILLRFAKPHGVGMRRGR